MKTRILIFLMLVLPLPGAAAELPYIFRSLNVDDGLSQNTVLAIIQDRTGFMWIGTKDGLNRYDGSEIRRITAVDAIPGNNYILSLCEDSEGNIWIGTDAGVCIYDPETERARRFLETADDGQTIAGSIPQIVMAPDSTLWIADENRGFYRYRPHSRRLEHIDGRGFGRSDYSARSICFNARGTAFFALKDGGIYLSEDNLLTAEPLLHDRAEIEAFRDRPVNKLTAGPFNRLFVCSARGLFEIVPATGRFRKIDLPRSNGYTRDLLTVKNDEIWVATESALEILNGDLKEIACFGNAQTTDPGLSNNAFYCLCRDRNGDMWIGTYFNGVAYCRVRNCTPFHRHHARQNDLGDIVREIVCDDDGCLWFGTESRGLFRFDPAADRIESISNNENLYADGRYSNVHGLCCDGEWLWAGTYEQNRTLVRINRRTLAAKSYPSAGKEIYSICRTMAGELLLGTTTGLRRYDRDRDRFEADPAIRCHIHQLREDSAGNLWAATYRNGLYRRTASGRWSHYLFDERDTASLAANKVLSIFEDSRDRLWFTTQSGGICRYVPESDSFVRYKNRLPLDTFYRIEEDGKGYFWISSNRGLLRFDPDTFDYFLYTTDDGLLDNQFNYSSSCKTREGRLFFGSINGLVGFDPSEIKLDDFKFPVVLTDFMLYNRHSGFEGDSPLEKSISLIERLDLAADENSFAIRVAAMNYQSPHEARMRYRLEGYDNGWHTLWDRTITYSNLPYRNYRLRVQGLYADGTPTGIERTLEIRIAPPFYRSTAACVLYVLLLAGAVVLLYTFFNLRALRQQKREIEKIERKKERELYVSKFDFFTNIAHEIRTPLSLIRGPLESILDKERDNPDCELREDLQTMEQNTDRLMVLINQLLDFRKVEKGGFELHSEECDIAAAVNAVFRRFAATARKRELDLRLDLPEEKLSASVDREALTKIVSNLLSNAMKYADRQVRLRLSVDTGRSRFEVVLTNDGPVVPLRMRETIFHPFVQYRDGKHVAAGTGIGLTLSRTLAELHGGTLVMDDDTAVNRFILSIPIVHRSTAAPSAAAPSAVAAASKPAGTLPGTKPRLLLVEDDPDMRTFIVRQLSHHYEVTTAENGCRALEKLEGETIFDLIVSDVMMPEMDGFELCGKLKTDLRFSHIPLLLLTAKTDTASKIEGVDLGADIYIEKPFSPEFLRSSIASLLSNRERVRRHFLESPSAREESLVHSRADEEFLRKLNDYINEQMERPELSVDDIADAMCMSSSNLFRKLKGIVGKNPNEYLRIKRLKQAAELLLQNNYTISDISLLVGFRSATYFSSCFKKQFGITPKEFVEKGKVEPTAPDE